MWEIAHVWGYEENSQTTDVIAYLMQYLFDKVLLFFSSKKENSKGKQQLGGVSETLVSL